jgi:glycosyltransferase involved in cell wall biosynthesis
MEQIVPQAHTGSHMTSTRKVFVATPCYDGRADVWYMNSLIQTIKMAQHAQMEIIPIWLSYDALIQRARNDCIALALETHCDDCVFIDSDVEWRPEWFFQLLNHPVDVVGGTYRKKSDSEETYVVKIDDITQVTPDATTGLWPVDGLGTGFLRLSKLAMQKLWNNSPAYTEIGVSKHRRHIFNVVVEDNKLISEDIWLCRRLKQLDVQIWLDPDITLNHVGTKKFQGNFQNWFRNLHGETTV